MDREEISVDIIYWSFVDRDISKNGTRDNSSEYQPGEQSDEICKR